MSRIEEVELTNMCMISDGKGNVLVQNKVGNADWSGWNFPGGHVEKGEYVTPSVIREVLEETGLTIENPRLCGIKEFHKLKDGKRYIVFLYYADEFFGELKSSKEGEIFWYPLSGLVKSDKLIEGFEDMISVFTDDNISEVFYERTEENLKTVFM
ncbi:MAG: 8-oxo-dGTP diphosphatase [Oscillospiraceae bacterium]|nr:8-oxo-dGTP diphosphatase [Oscillospiraceae bacterium]MBQ2998406.1 8-oxo-dGTP diphosphatase [Oscillospiraceae bacterium]MBQ6699025.1 8-oxo-dGTP diphosphatase [Oscillospiraceae bacterium]